MEEKKKEEPKIVSAYMNKTEHEILMEYMLKNKIFSFSAAIKELIGKGYEYDKSSK